jgi:hypothetical protein
MKIEPAFPFHEGGHLVTGLRLGLTEQGIVFRPLKPGDAAHAVYTFKDPQTSLVRCFAGLLAQLHLLPDSLEPHLVHAYTHSIIFEPDHPHFNALTDEERDFLSGARTDMIFARKFGADIVPGAPIEALELMRASEKTARHLIVSAAADIAAVAKDVVAFGSEPEAGNPHFVLYSAERAKQHIQHSRHSRRDSRLKCRTLPAE